MVVVDKAAGLLTVSTGRDDERTAYSQVTDWLKKGQAKSRERAFLVHRLDRGTSGLLVFARREETKRALQEGWDESDKRYLAVVEGRPEPEEGLVRSYLAENTALRVYSTDNEAEGKLSETRYRVVRSDGVTSLVEVELVTGRKHQIRVHLSERGWPVVGDRRYGGAMAKAPRLGLHAYRLAIRHPRSGEEMRFEAPAPAAFKRLMKWEGGR
jgi:RluA family pseudouridine synthase